MVILCPAELPMTGVTEPQSEEGGGKQGQLQAIIAQVPFFFFLGVGSDAGVPEEAERCGGSPGLLQRPAVKLSPDRGEWSPAWICSSSIITFAHAHNHDCSTTWLKFSWSKCELIYLPMKHQSNFSIFLFALKAKPCVVVLLTLVLRPHLTYPRLIFLFPMVRELLTVNGNFQLALCKSSCKIDQ